MPGLNSNPIWMAWSASSRMIDGQSAERWLLVSVETNSAPVRVAMASSYILRLTRTSSIPPKANQERSGGNTT